MSLEAGSRICDSALSVLGAGRWSPLEGCGCCRQLSPQVAQSPICCQPPVPTQTDSFRRPEGGCQKCVYYPSIPSVTYILLCLLAGEAVLGHKGDCFKVLVKGNGVTTCLISPECKMIRNQRRLFPSAQAAGAGGLSVLFTSLCAEGNQVPREVLHERRCCTELQLVPRQLRAHSHQERLFAWKFLPIKKRSFKWSNI